MVRPSREVSDRPYEPPIVISRTSSAGAFTLPPNGIQRASPPAR